ncbi:MAG: DUF885 domain-containing protein [Caulobacteraceae bacterium]
MLDRRHFLATTAAAAFAGRAFAAPAAAGSANAAVDALLAETAEALLVEYPENATGLGIDTGARAPLKARLSGRTQADRAHYAATCAARLKRLRMVDATALSAQTAINHAAAVYAHELADEGYRRFSFGEILPLHQDMSYASTPYVVNPSSCGFFSYVPDFIENKHEVATAADAEAYLSRMEAFAVGLDGETDRLQRDAAQGMIPPDFTIDTSLGQLTGYRSQPVETWGMVETFDRKAREKGLAGTFGDKARALAAERVGPALDRQIEALKAVRPSASPVPGVWARHDGEAWYQWALKAATTTSISPDEVHRIGLAQNEAIDAQIDTLLRQQGLTQGTVGERMTALGKNPKSLWPNTDAGRAELLAYLNGVVGDIRARLPQAFTRLPKFGVEVRRVPPAIEAGAPNGYAGAGSIDGSRPGVYNINLRDMNNWPKFSLPTLTLHEAVPGHILQGSYQNQLPLIMALLAFNAYSEGWALYSEQLGDELGLYADDPLGKLGYLQSIKFRAVRLVVDTGMHAKRWDREKAVQFMIAATGRPEGATRSEIDRYCFWPGQACGYKVGHNEINRLRDQAKAALGPRFDVRAFDDVVVESGNVPLAVLGGVLERWTAGVRA